MCAGSRRSSWLNHFKFGGHAGGGLTGGMGGHACRSCLPLPLVLPCGCLLPATLGPNLSKAGLGPAVGKIGWP
jgi:hypothetical protein